MPNQTVKIDHRLKPMVDFDFFIATSYKIVASVLLDSSDFKIKYKN